MTEVMVEPDGDSETESTFNKILAVVYPRVRSFLSGTCSGILKSVAECVGNTLLICLNFRGYLTISNIVFPNNA